MKQTGQGILPQSEIYFSSPSQRAKKLFYTVLCAGHFFCDNNYNLKRDSYDSFLILHIINGSFSFINKEGNEIHAKKGETVLIDCYSPHAYCTYDYLESVWVHISGANLRALYEDIIASSSSTKGKSDLIKHSLFKIMDSIKPENMVSEAEISLEVYKLFMYLSEPQNIQSNDNYNHDDVILNIKDYIANHTNDNITVKSLADMAHMSVTHFSRIFKAKCGFSPYDYVLTVRLNKAKELLLKTTLSVTEIAYETGFNSEANFIYCFTKSEGVSPGKFRKTIF